MDIPEIDVEAAAAHLEAGDAVFMDVRDGATYAAAHIPGARHVSDATLAEFLEDTPKDAKIIVYCYHGNASRGGTAYLLDKGFADVASMAGGFEAWRGRHPETRGN